MTAKVQKSLLWFTNNKNSSHTHTHIAKSNLSHAKLTKTLKRLEADEYNSDQTTTKKKHEWRKTKKSYIFRVEAKWQPVQSLTRLVLLLVRIRTGIPSNWGSTGWRKGRDSGSCRYKASRVGISAWRSSSGLKTGWEGQEKAVRDERVTKWGGSCCVWQPLQEVVLQQFV